MSELYIQKFCTSTVFNSKKLHIFYKIKLSRLQWNLSKFQ